MCTVGRVGSHGLGYDCGWCQNLDMETWATSILVCPFRKNILGKDASLLDRTFLIFRKHLYVPV